MGKRGGFPGSAGHVPPAASRGRREQNPPRQRHGALTQPFPLQNPRQGENDAALRGAPASECEPQAPAAGTAPKIFGAEAGVVRGCTPGAGWAPGADPGQKPKPQNPECFNTNLHVAGSPPCVLPVPKTKDTAPSTARPTFGPFWGHSSLLKAECCSWGGSLHTPRLC